MNTTTKKKLQKFIDIKNDLKEKINAKGGSITDTTPFAEYPSIADELMGSGGSGDPTGKHKVTYFDLDGSELKVEYVEDGGTTTPPSDPSYDSEYLRFVGWSDIPETITSDYLIGAKYETITGDTYLFIKLTEVIGLEIPSMRITNVTSIDWGDGNVDTNFGINDTNVTHTYADYGEYVIKISGIVKFRDYLFNSSSNVYNNSLQKVYIGNTVTDISSNVFNRFYNLASINIPENITNIGVYSFYSCWSLKGIVLPETITAIGYSVFYNCYMLTYIVLPNNITAINDSLFYCCKCLQTISMPESVTSMGVNIFYGCNCLKSINIPRNLTSMKANMFYECYILSNIIIPENITSFEHYVFYSCNNLLNCVLTCTSVPTMSSSGIFNNINKIATIWVRDELVDSYKSATNWSTYASYIKPLSSMSDKLREELGL